MFFVSQGKVRTAARRGGQFCCSSVVNLLQYLCARNYQNTVRLNKVIKKVYFLSHSAYIIYDAPNKSLVSDRCLCCRHRSK